MGCHVGGRGAEWRCFFVFQAEDGIRDGTVTGVQTCALPIYGRVAAVRRGGVAVVEGGQAELPGQGSGVGAGDEVQVVDAGQRGRLRVVLVVRGLGMGVPADDLRERLADLA